MREDAGVYVASADASATQVACHMPLRSEDRTTNAAQREAGAHVDSLILQGSHFSPFVGTVAVQIFNFE